MGHDADPGGLGRTSGHEELKPIRDFIMDAVEKLGIEVTIDTGWNHKNKAYPLWILILRPIPCKPDKKWPSGRYRDGQFAEIHLMSDGTIQISSCLPITTKEYWVYPLSDPESFENVISKTKELLQKAVAGTQRRRLK